MKYYPMDDLTKKLSRNNRYVYDIIAKIHTEQDETEGNLNKSLRITSNNKLTAEEVVQQAIDLINNLIVNQWEYDAYDVALINGITIVAAYDRELNVT